MTSGTQALRICSIVKRTPQLFCRRRMVIFLSLIFAFSPIGKGNHENLVEQSLEINPTENKIDEDPVLESLLPIPMEQDTINETVYTAGYKKIVVNKNSSLEKSTHGSHKINIPLENKSSKEISGRGYKDKYLETAKSSENKLLKSDINQTTEFTSKMTIKREEGISDKQFVTTKAPGYNVDSIPPTKMTLITDSSISSNSLSTANVISNGITYLTEKIANEMRNPSTTTPVATSTLLYDESTSKPTAADKGVLTTESILSQEVTDIAEPMHSIIESLKTVDQNLSHQENILDSLKLHISTRTREKTSLESPSILNSPSNSHRILFDTMINMNQPTNIHHMLNPTMPVPTTTIEVNEITAKTEVTETGTETTESTHTKKPGDILKKMPTVFPPVLNLNHIFKTNEQVINSDGKISQTIIRGSEKITNKETAKKSEIVASLAMETESPVSSQNSLTVHPAATNFSSVLDPFEELNQQTNNNAILIPNTTISFSNYNVYYNLSTPETLQTEKETTAETTHSLISTEVKNPTPTTTVLFSTVHKSKNISESVSPTITTIASESNDISMETPLSSLQISTVSKRLINSNSLRTDNSNALTEKSPASTTEKTIQPTDIHEETVESIGFSDSQDGITVISVTDYSETPSTPVNFILHSDSIKHPCMTLTASIQLIIQCNSSTKKMKRITMNVPEDAHVSGSCYDLKTLIITWSNNTYTLTFENSNNFIDNETTKQEIFYFSIEKISLSISNNSNHFQGCISLEETFFAWRTNVTFSKSPREQYFKSRRTQPLLMETGHVAILFTTKGLQAFLSPHKNDKNVAAPYSSITTFVISGGVVGLLALLFILLIFLFKRKRSLTAKNASSNLKMSNYTYNYRHVNNC